MPERSAISLLGILQRHGLSVEVLELWVEFCETHKTGSFTFHHVHGEIQIYEPHYKHRVDALKERDLTKLSHAVHNGIR